MENITGNARTIYDKTFPFFNISINKLYNLSVSYPQGKYIYCMWSPGHAGRSNSITAGTEEGTKIIGGKLVYFCFRFLLYKYGGGAMPPTLSSAGSGKIDCEDNKGTLL